MANLGENLRNWRDTVWKSDDAREMEIFDKEWKKATRKLVASTPEGQIRFVLVNRWKIIKRLKRNPFFKKDYYFINAVMNEKSSNQPFFISCPSDLSFPLITETSFDYNMQAKEMILYYANNIEKYHYAGRDLIWYWFETQILPDFERETKKRKLNCLATSDDYELYWYNKIRNCLEHFNINFNEEEYKEIFTHLCNKNGVKLVGFDYKSDSFKISL